jgi:hypothetical protein
MTRENAGMTRENAGMTRKTAGMARAWRFFPVILFFSVIPAEAGIQTNKDGFRIKSGMTTL